VILCYLNRSRTVVSVAKLFRFMYKHTVAKTRICYRTDRQNML